MKNQNKRKKPGRIEGEGGEKVNMSGMRRDFMLNNLRSQSIRLSSLLDSITEEEAGLDCEDTHISLKAIELNLRQIRKLCINN